MFLEVPKLEVKKLFSNRNSKSAEKLSSSLFNSSGDLTESS